MDTAMRPSFWSEFLRGLSSPGDMFGRRIELPEGSDLDAMRSDWERIGQDFRTVIAREEASLQESSTSPTDPAVTDANHHAVRRMERPAASARRA